MNLTHDQEFQRQILAHPAYRARGVDPLWRVIAVLGWATVLALMLALSARAHTLVIGQNGQRAARPVCELVGASPFGTPAGSEMKPLALSNDDRSISPRPIFILLTAPARDCGSGANRTGAGRNL